jgi:DNA-binding response OmpR family regulator
VHERVLVVEDDHKVAGALREGLRAERYMVEVSDSGAEGLLRASTEQFDLILLDRLLQELDGVTVLRTIRTNGVRTPVLMVTARDSVEDRVTGLDAGADDYLVKPFAFPELLARMRALLRHERFGTSTDVRLSVGDLEMDLIARTATRGGHSINLTAKEFQLLVLLVHNAGTVVSRDTLAQQAWPGFERNTWLDNAIDVHVGRIRKKVDADHDVAIIHTVRGLGFVVRS